MSSTKPTNFVLGFQTTIEPLDNTSSKKDRSKRDRTMKLRHLSSGSYIQRSYAKRTVTTVVSSNEVDAKDNRIQPSIYALAVKGRNEVNHELQGSTRDELRASLKFALQQMPGWSDLKRIVISDVKFSNRYKSISANLGYTAEEYIEELLDLYSIWKAQGYIEVYENNSERTYGCVKDSNSTIGSTPFFIDLYHARVVNGENDPLVVLEFEKSVDGNQPILVIKFLVHHDDMFGTKKDKGNRQIMLGIRKNIDDYRKEGND